ncbi:hypothetical protein AAY473_038072 [Plecturocebus cupreus]
MVLLHEEQLLLESLDLCLQLQPIDSGVINDLAKPMDVTLHRLAHGQLCLILDSKVISSKCSQILLSSLQFSVSSLCPVGGQAVVQALHGLIPARPLAIPVARPPDPMPPQKLVEQDTEMQEPEPPVPA